MNSPCKSGQPRFSASVGSLRLFFEQPTESSQELSRNSSPYGTWDQRAKPPSPPEVEKVKPPTKSADAGFSFHRHRRPQGEDHQMVLFDLQRLQIPCQIINPHFAQVLFPFNLREHRPPDRHLARTMGAL